MSGDLKDGLLEEKKEIPKQRKKFYHYLICDGAFYLYALLFFFWIFCLNYLGVGAIGIARNSLTGQMHLQDLPGWYLTSPFVKVAKLSTLPMVADLPSEAKVVNRKLVRFDKKGWKQFVEMQGFYYYGGSLNNILRGYAFSGDWLFLEILQEVE